MIDYILQKLIDSGVSIAKDILSKRIKEKNDELLDEKKKKAKKRQLPQSEIESLTLDEQERIQYRIWIDKNEGCQSLASHISFVRDWASQVGFSDLRGTKSVRDIYTELDIYLTPVRRHFDLVEREDRRPLSTALFEEKSHVVIFGPPGAGKTTSMKKLCSSVLDSPAGRENISRVPLLIRLRDIEPHTAAEKPLFSKLSSIISFRFELRNAYTKQVADFNDTAILVLLEQIRAIIVLDGFDEIATDELKNAVLAEFRLLCQGLKESKVVLTCRTGQFNYHVDNSQDFELAPLTQRQIAEFTRRWIKDADKASRFLDEVKNSPFCDTVIKPLSLAHLCAIYNRIGRIPERPKTVYRKVVNLLLEEWDEQRSVKRQSRYAEFESDRKAEFLSHLAFYLTTTTGRTIFGHEELSAGYREIRENFGLPEDQEELVVSEIESHTGLFVQSGYDQYEFAHKSIQEYLAADYIVRLPAVPSRRQILQTIPNELAIAVAVSSNPSLYFSELVINRLSRAALPHSFYDAFVNRLVLEKPKFYEHRDLVLAVHVLLSFWVCDGEITSTQLRVRGIFSDSLVRFISFNDSISTKLTRETLADYYYLDSEFPVNVGEVALYRYKKKGEHEEYKLPTYILAYEMQ